MLALGHHYKVHKGYWNFNNTHIIPKAHAMVQLVEVLVYDLEGCRFISQVCYWNFC
jgi:hypothetical protein